MPRACDMRGTSAWMNALCWKKFRCRQHLPRAPCTGHDASLYPVSGQWKRESGAKPIVMRSLRLTSASSRNSTPGTLHRSGNCKAAVNSEVVSIPPNSPNVLTANQPSPTKQRKAFCLSASWPMMMEEEGL